jgi:hypothetical protein
MIHTTEGVIAKGSAAFAIAKLKEKNLVFNELPSDNDEMKRIINDFGNSYAVIPSHAKEDMHECLNYFLELMKTHLPQYQKGKEIKSTVREFIANTINETDLSLAHRQVLIECITDFKKLHTAKNIDNVRNNFSVGDNLNGIKKKKIN